MITRLLAPYLEGGFMLTYCILPLTEDVFQIFSLSLAPDGYPLEAWMEVRYLPGIDGWVLSIWDDATGEQLVNQIPIICSLGQVNDLLRPFRHLRDGKGLGSLFCIRAEDATTTPDPAAGNLRQFQVLFGDTIPG